MPKTTVGSVTMPQAQLGPGGGDPLVGCDHVDDPPVGCGRVADV